MLVSELEEKLSESNKSLQSMSSSDATAKTKVEGLQQEIVTLKESSAKKIEVSCLLVSKAFIFVLFEN